MPAGSYNYEDARLGMVHRRSYLGLTYPCGTLTGAISALFCKKYPRKLYLLVLLSPTSPSLFKLKANTYAGRGRQGRSMGSSLMGHSHGRAITPDAVQSQVRNSAELTATSLLSLLNLVASARQFLLTVQNPIPSIILHT